MVYWQLLAFYFLILVGAAFNIMEYLNTTQSLPFKVYLPYAHTLSILLLVVWFHYFRMKQIQLQRIIY